VASRASAAFGSIILGVKERKPALNKEAAMYLEMSEPELLGACGDNAWKWAEAFKEIVVDSGRPIDHGWLVGWFANAIERSSVVRHAAQMDASSRA